MEDPNVPAQTGGAGEDPKPSGDQSPPKGGDQVQALLRKMRKMEKELNAYKEADESRKQGELSETEKLKKQLESSNQSIKQLSDRLKTQAVQYRFEAAAQKAGAVDTTAAFKLADLSGVEVDDDGNVNGIDEAVKALQQSSKFLFGALPSKGVGGNNPASEPPGGSELSPARITAMSADEFRADFQKRFGVRI